MRKSHGVLHVPKWIVFGGRPYIAIRQLTLLVLIIYKGDHVVSIMFLTM